MTNSNLRYILGAVCVLLFSYVFFLTDSPNKSWALVLLAYGLFNIGMGYYFAKKGKK